MHKSSFPILIITIIIALILNYLGLFEAINTRIYDNLIIFNKSKKVNNTIVIVKIDKDSIKTIGQWPWKRSAYIKALNNLNNAGAAVIGINLAFTEKKDSEDDSKLYKTLKKLPHVVLSATYIYKQIGPKEIYLPVFSIYPDITHAHTNIKYSEKSVIRNLRLFNFYPAFSLQVLKYYYAHNKVASGSLHNKIQEWFKFIEKNHYNSKETMLIDYKRTPLQFKQYSFIDIYNGNFEARNIKDKIILIGLTQQSRVTGYATPFTGVETLSTTPVELQAQIIDSLLNFRNLQEINSIVQYILAITLAIGFFFFTRGKRAFYQGILFVSFIFILALCNFILFKFFALWVPPGFLIILLFSTFGLSVYFTTTKLDNKLIEYINNINKSENIPLIELPEGIENRLDALSRLTEIINDDRQTIKAIIDGVNNGIVVFNNKGTIVWSNTFILKLFPDSLILNQNIDTIFKPLTINDVTENLLNKSFYKLELAFNNKDYICIINPIKSSSNLYVLIMNDITDLKEIDRLKTEMVRMVSHELKSPLMVIQVSSEMISFDKKNEESIDQNVENITEATSFMLETINNFLNLNKLESNLIEINIIPENIAELIHKIIRLQEPIAADRNIDIRFTPSDNLPEVLMDQNQITIVLNNLISNAIKYSEDNKQIDITVERENAYLKISVIDYGIGIPEKDVERIFDKFFRSENNEKKDIKGTGLGLAIVSRIINMHNGEINVTSEYKNGSCFYFSLPIA